MKQKIFFRADAGEEIGYGHFIRSLALADMLKNDFECVMFTQNPSDYQRKEASGVCKMVALPSDDSKYQIFLDYLIGDEIVVLDNYFFTTEYQRKIKANGCKLVCIDDMHDKHYVADVVINHGCNDSSLFSVETYTRLCLGMSWALLRKPFLDVANCLTERKQEKKTEHVVVCFGGSDPKNLTQKAVIQLAQNPDIKLIDVIIGSRIDTLVGSIFNRIESVCPKVSIHQSISAQEVATLFSNCDMAIVSASSVAMEALACGARVAAGWYVDNQRDFYKMISEAGCIYPMGDLNGSAIQLKHTQEDLIVPQMGDIRLKYRSLFAILQIDDFAVSEYKYVSYIHLSEEINRQVWEIRNLPEMRKCMTHDQPFSFEDHLKFVESLKQTVEKVYWAVMKDGRFVASISLHPINWMENSAEWGIYANPAFSGKGMTKEVCRLFFSKVVEQTTIRLILASVKIDNVKSLKFHHSVGFVTKSHDAEYYYLENKLN